jgi:peptide/nickel transport system permease protein
MGTHVLINVLPSTLVLATLQVGWAILTEASLSFLGAGVPPPHPAWGSMVSDGRNLLQTSWWVPIVPGAAILLVTVAVNIVGDWLRDKFDPTLL